MMKLQGFQAIREEEFLETTFMDVRLRLMERYRSFPQDSLRGITFTSTIIKETSGPVFKKH